MIKNYQLNTVCLKKGVITQLKPGLYPLELMTDIESMKEEPETVSYMDPVSGEVVTMPFTQFRRAGKPKRMYVDWDGEKLHAIEELPFHLKVVLDHGYRMKTEEHLEGQDFTPISLPEFYEEHNITSLEGTEGKVYTDRKTTFFRNFPGEDDVFIKIVKEGDTLVPFTKMVTMKDE